MSTPTPQPGMERCGSLRNVTPVRFSITPRFLERNPTHLTYFLVADRWELTEGHGHFPARLCLGGINNLRRSMRNLVVILSLLTLEGCSDETTTRFATLADAKTKEAFVRGWVPPILPDSATSIVERNNLDLNTGMGSFDYDSAERSRYINRLTEAGALSRTEGDIDILTLSTNVSRWEIRLPRNSGAGGWRIRQL